MERVDVVSTRILKRASFTQILTAAAAVKVYLPNDLDLGIRLPWIHVVATQERTSSTFILMF
jgi:hypothetical protein